jgi:hypothetical protein
VNGKDEANLDAANLRVLAFQGTGQRCGFLPDAQPGKDDLGNVRDGHYLIWGPMHFYLRAVNAQPIEEGRAGPGARPPQAVRP